LAVGVEMRFVKHRYKKQIEDITNECTTSIQSIQKCVEGNGGSIKKCKKKG